MTEEQINTVLAQIKERWERGEPLQTIVDAIYKQSGICVEMLDIGISTFVKIYTGAPKPRTFYLTPSVR